MQVEAPTSWRVWVPAGKYILGDPCYAVSDAPSEDTGRDLWCEAGESCNWWQDSPVAIIMVNGKSYNILGFGTAYGDGEYIGSDGFSYPVDSGMIGLVPAEIADTLTYDGLDLHKPIEFTRDTLCTCTNGIMKFGEIVINTRE